MRWQDIGDMTCSIARALSVVGDRWTLLILRDAFLRTRRFEDFQTNLGITRHRLADRLRKLINHGIFERVRYQERPARYEYRLTEKGRDLYPVIVSLVGWGDRWMAGDAGAPIELVHRTCGHQISPVLTCPDCRAPITARDMQVRPGPALRALKTREASFVKRISPGARRSSLVKRISSRAKAGKHHARYASRDTLHGH